MVKVKVHHKMYIRKNLPNSNKLDYQLRIEQLSMTTSQSLLDNSNNYNKMLMINSHKLPISLIKLEMISLTNFKKSTNT